MSDFMFKKKEGRVKEDFAFWALIAAVSELGIAEQVAEKYNSPEGVEVKMVVDGREYNMQKLFERMEENFKATVEEEASNLISNKANEVGEIFASLMKKNDSDLKKIRDLVEGN